MQGFPLLKSGTAKRRASEERQESQEDELEERILVEYKKTRTTRKWSEPFAPSHHQPKGQIGMVGMTHREGEYISTDPLAAGIPQPATAPGLFALRDLPGGFELALKEQTILVSPAQDKAGGVVLQGPQPQTAGEGGSMIAQSSLLTKGLLMPPVYRIVSRFCEAFLMTEMRRHTKY